MEKFLKKDFKVIRNILALVLIFVTVMMATVSVSASSETTDDDEASDYSFYHLASVAATTLSDVKASTDLSMDSVFGTIPSNAAGGLLGYADSDTSKGIVGLVQSSLSTSSSTYSYRALAQTGYSQDGSYPFLPYVMVGAGLADSGADTYGVGLMNMSISRPLLGGLTFLVYLVADSVAWVFSKIIGILKMLNPFQFFAKVSTNDIKPSTDATNTAAIQIDGTVYSDLGSETGFNNAVFDNVKEFVSYWYETMASFGSTIAYIVLFISLTLLILGRNKAKHWGRIKRSVFRLVFIFVGIPICGSTYTVALNGIDITSSVSNGQYTIDNILANTTVSVSFETLSQSFTVDFSNFHPVDGVYEYTLPHIVYPEWQTFYDEYVTTHFNYIFEGIDAIYESVRYSMLDAAKDALPFTVGALALVGGYYAVKIMKCQKEIEQVNQEIWKHEDKLFWNK